MTEKRDYDDHDIEHAAVAATYAMAAHKVLWNYVTQADAEGNSLMDRADGDVWLSKVEGILLDAVHALELLAWKEAESRPGMHDLGRAYLDAFFAKLDAERSEAPQVAS